MEDQEIIALFWARSEHAIEETANKYGLYCRQIAYNILESITECEECVNDAYLQAWNSIPPNRPSKLRLYLGKITRQLAIDRYRYLRAEKRGAGRMTLALDELQLSDTVQDRVIDKILLRNILNEFLAGLRPDTRKIFIKHYWYLRTVKEIAAEMDISESKVKMTLLRCRNELKKALEKEGVSV